MDVNPLSTRPPTEHRASRSMRSAAVFPGLFGAALAIGLSSCGGTSTNEPTRTTDQEVQLVTLESAQSPGTSPWMDSVTSPGVPNRVPRVETASTTRTVSGDTVGLYGGTANLVVCDRDKMVGFLEQNPPLAAAWRSVTGAVNVRDYAKDLSPLLLTRDARVTNHGFRNGQPTAFQSILQTGTAVMVDNRGLPRVRCDSGSPLSEPQGDMTYERFTGTGWQSLDPKSAVTIEKSEQQLTSLDVVDAGGAAAPPTSQTTSEASTTAATGPQTSAELPRAMMLQITFGNDNPKPVSVTLPPGATVVTVAVEPPLTLQNTAESTTTMTESETTTTTTTTTTPSSTETTTTAGGTEISTDEPPVTEPQEPTVEPTVGGTPTTVIEPQGELPPLP